MTYEILKWSCMHVPVTLCVTVPNIVTATVTVLNNKITRDRHELCVLLVCPAVSGQRDCRLTAISFVMDCTCKEYYWHALFHGNYKRGNTTIKTSVLHEEMVAVVIAMHDYLDSLALPQKDKKHWGIPVIETGT